MRRLSLFIIMLSVLAGTAVAGEYAADFLRIGVGARPLGMGGAFVSLADDASGMVWNPAGAAQVEKAAVHLDHAALFQGLAQYNAVSASFLVQPELAVGVSWIRLGVDEIPRYNALQGTRLDRYTTGRNRSTGEPEGYFQDNENAVLVTVAKSMHFDFRVGPGFNKIDVPLDVSFGVTGKTIHQNLDDHRGSGQGVDAGILASIPTLVHTSGNVLARFNLGAAIRDAARTTLVWDTDSKHRDQIDPAFVLGASYQHHLPVLKADVTVAVDREMGDYDAWYYGAEMSVFNRIALRAGMSDEHFTAGAGIQWGGVRVDYAFISHTLDNTHRVSGGFYF